MTLWGQTSTHVPHSQHEPKSTTSFIICRKVTCTTRSLAIEVLPERRARGKGAARCVLRRTTCRPDLGVRLPGLQALDRAAALGEHLLDGVEPLGRVHGLRDRRLD